jgi:hypothetical protein
MYVIDRNGYRLYMRKHFGPLAFREKAMRKIEAKHANIEDAINRIQALKTAENENYIEEEYTTCKKWKYVLLFIILVLIFVVLY